MAKWEYAVITNDGLSLQSKMVAGSTMVLTKVKTGAGSVPAVLLQQQTDITNPKQEFLFSGNPNYLGEAGTVELPFVLTNDGLTEGYDCYQIGIYANDPDKGEILYAILQSATALEVPTPEQIPGWSTEFNVAAQFGNAESVSVQINTSGLANHINDKQNPHGVTAEQVGAVPLDGSVPMTGKLKINRRTAPSIDLNRTNSDGTIRDSVSIEHNNSWADIAFTSDSPEFETGLRFNTNEASLNNRVNARIDGVDYPLFGEHNIDLLKTHLPVDPTNHINDKQNPHGVTAAQIGAVPTTRKINGKPLTEDITIETGTGGMTEDAVMSLLDGKSDTDHTHTAADVDAVPTSRTVNGKALSSNVTLVAADVGAVPETRKINGKPLTSDITIDVPEGGLGEDKVNAKLANYLPLDGSTPMTNTLKIKKRTGAAIELIRPNSDGTINDTVTLENKAGFGSLKRRVESTGSETELVLWNNDVGLSGRLDLKLDGTTYPLFGEHNVTKSTTDIGAGSAMTSLVHLVYEE